MAQAYAKRKNSRANDRSTNAYEEEESYENPVNLSKAPGAVDEYVDIRSEQNLTAEQSTFIKQIDHEEDKLIAEIKKQKSPKKVSKKADNYILTSLKHEVELEDRIKAMAKLEEQKEASPSPKNSTIKVLKDDIKLTDADLKEGGQLHEEPILSNRNLPDEYGNNSS